MSSNELFRFSLREAQQSNDIEGIKYLLSQNKNSEYTKESNLASILALINELLQNHTESKKYLDIINFNELDVYGKADYALLLFIKGEIDCALEILKSTTLDSCVGFESFMRLGVIELFRENLLAAESAFKSALERNPQKAEIISNLGGVKFRLGQYKEALELYDQTISIRPDLPQPREMRARALIALDRSDEMVESAQQSLDNDPSDPTRHHYLATVQIQAECWNQAEATLNAAIERFPERDDFKRLLVNLLFERKEINRVGLILKEWVDARDSYDWTSLALNRARIEAGYLDAAKSSLEELADTYLGNEPVYYLLHAKILIERAKAEEAVDILIKALETFPGNNEIRSLLAHTLTSLGRFSEADSYFDQTAITNPMEIVRYVEGQGKKAKDVEIRQLEKLFQSTHLESDSRARVGFTLSRALDKKKEYKRAFEVLKKANELVNRRINYDWRDHRRFTDKQIEVISYEVVDRLAKFDRNKSERPIFVLGMPRSGTTLVEQILCSHPKVYGAGELQWVPRIRSLIPKVVEGKKRYPEAMKVLTERNLKSAAKYYLDKVAEQENESPRVVDKLPHNFDNLALIVMMFPNAKIIHMERNPRDVAVSNFFQNFSAAHGLMGFSFNLKNIGHMINDHDQIMKHWHYLFSHRIYELNYQQLVSKPEETVNELLNYCGLNWDDQVMQFYDTKRPVRTASIRQVREGIYTTSTERWKRFEEFLEPLEDILAEGYKPLEECDESRRYKNVIAGPTRIAAN